MTAIEKLVPLLRDRLGGTVQVYGEEVPEARVPGVPGAGGTVVVESDGGAERRGTLGHFQIRVMVLAYGDNYFAASRLADRVREVLEAVRVADGFQFVRRESGPYAGRDEVRRWSGVSAGYLCSFTG